MPNDLGKVVKALTKASKVLDQKAIQFLYTTGTEIKDEGTSIIYLHTPEDETPRPSGAEALKDTTSGEIGSTSDGALILWRQTKTVPWRNHKDIILWRLLTDGREGGYFNEPVNKKALSWVEVDGGREFRAWTYGGYALPDDYIKQSTQQIKLLSLNSMKRAGTQMISLVSEALH